MHAFARKLITEWRRLGLSTDAGTAIVAVSGGADSVSLLIGLRELLELQKLGLRIVASHFNHRLRGTESNADESFVRHLAKELGIELVVGHGDIETAGNLEQNARRARYAFLTSVAESLGVDHILTGHTINDQAETFLMNLIRGSGIDGLSAMPAVRELGEHGSSVRLVRPLLSWAKRADSEQYCESCGIEYRNDAMNDDTVFKRVRIRKELLPLLAEMNPNIVETLANTAVLMRQAAEFGPDAGDEMQAQLDLAALRLMTPDKLTGLLRTWLIRCRGSSRQIGLKHIEAIGRLVLSEKSGRMVELPGGGTVTRSGGKLSFEQI